MITEKIKTVSGNELLKMDLPDLKYPVEGFLPQGFHIVSGMPKTGKSWLLLLLCLRVSEGNPFWFYQTNRGTVLYLCLEDSFNRIQQRLNMLTEEAPGNLYFAVMANSISDGLVPQIEMFLDDHPETNLIVIDTLQKVRDAAGDNYYAADYKDIGALKTIADDHGIAIVAVQHLRKQRDCDPHLMVSGSTGLTGAADGSYVLQKNEVNSPDAKLFIRGRDVEERVLTLRFDPETCVWECTGGETPIADAMKTDPQMRLLISYIQKEKEFSGTVTELTQTIGIHVAGQALSRKLTRFQKPLAEIGIRFEKSRTGQQRGIHLFLSAGDPE